MKLWNLSDKAKKISKSTILASSLFLWTPENAVANDIQDNIWNSCNKIWKILKIQANIDKNLQPDTYNLDYWKLNWFLDISKNFCKNPSWIWLEKDLFLTWEELEKFEKFEKEFLKYDKNYFWDFFKLQKNFLAKYKNFLKNFTDEKIFSWNLTYEIQKWDTLSTIIKKVFQTTSQKEVNKILKKLNIKNKRNLKIWDKIDFWKLYDSWKLSTKNEISEELQEKYKMWFEHTMYIKWWHIPLLLDPNRMYNEKRWRFFAACSAFQQTSEGYNFKWDNVSSFNYKWWFQPNAYDAYPEIIKNWWKVLDTWKNTIQLVYIKNIQDYWKIQYKNLKLKLDNKNFETEKTFKIKEIKKRKNWIRNPADRIVKMKDNNWESHWIWLQESSIEDAKNKATKTYQQAEKNPWSYIFFHYTLTNEYPKIIHDQYQKYLNFNNLSKKNQKLPASSLWSHYVKNFWIQKIDYSLYRLQEMNQKWEHLWYKNINKSEKITLWDAISIIIPWWNNIKSDNFLNKEEIFKKVEITIWEWWETYTQNLYEIWKWEKEWNWDWNLDWILSEENTFSVKWVMVWDEYNAQWRIIPLIKLFTQIEKYWARFIPTESVMPNKKFLKPVNPYFIEVIENTDWIEFAWIDSPRIFKIENWKFNAKKILPEIKKWTRNLTINQINRIFEFYNKNIADKNWFPYAEWNKNTWKVKEWSNSIFYEFKWWKITFLKQERSFDEIFKRWVKEWKYTEANKPHVKYFLTKIWKSQAEEKWKKFNRENFWLNRFPLNSNQKIIMFKFTWDWSTSNVDSLISNWEKLKLKKIEDINKIWKNLWIKFYETLTQDDLNKIQSVVKDPFMQSVLISNRWYETQLSQEKNPIREQLDEMWLKEFFEKNPFLHEILILSLFMIMVINKLSWSRFKSLNFLPFILYSVIIWSTISVSKNSVENYLSEIDQKIWTEIVWTIWDFQISLKHWVKIYEKIFNKDFNKLKWNIQTELLKKFLSKTNTEFENNFKIKLKDYLLSDEYKNNQNNKNYQKNDEKFIFYKKIIRDFILDKENTWVKYIAALLFIEDKNKIINNYAKIYYWDQYHSIISQETTKQSYQDNLLKVALDSYKWSIKANIYRWLSYTTNAVLNWKENIQNSDIENGLTKDLIEKTIEAVKNNKDIINDLNLKITPKSKENTFKLNDKNESNILRTLWWDAFKKPMKWNSWENYFQVVKKIYKEKFKKTPEFWLPDDFRENYKYKVKWKNIKFFDNPLKWLKNTFKWKNKDHTETPRWSIVMKNAKKILDKK